MKPRPPLHSPNPGRLNVGHALYHPVKGKIFVRRPDVLVADLVVFVPEGEKQKRGMRHGHPAQAVHGEGKCLSAARELQPVGVQAHIKPASRVTASPLSRQS